MPSPRLSFRFPALVSLLLLGAGWLIPAVASAQDDLDPERAYVSRERLEELLSRWERAAASPAYSEQLRDQARQEAEAIQDRLENGDFRVGDQIFLNVEEETALTDSFVVGEGPAVTLPEIGEISLAGVLRYELGPYMEEQLGRFIREPKVRAISVLRITVRGGAARPGFYAFPAQIPFTQALMTAGGPGQSDLADIRVQRRGVTLWEGERIEEAIANGYTLDQMNLRPGDEIIFPSTNQFLGLGGGGRGGLGGLGGRRGGSGNMIRTVTLLLSVPFTIFGIFRILN